MNPKNTREKITNSWECGREHSLRFRWHQPFRSCLSNRRDTDIITSTILRCRFVCPRFGLHFLSPPPCLIPVSPSSRGLSTHLLCWFQHYCLDVFVFTPNVCLCFLLRLIRDCSIGPTSHCVSWSSCVLQCPTQDKTKTKQIFVGQTIQIWITFV